MKSSNYLLIYDDHCPLCQWYSAQFVKLGVLAESNRQPFSTLDMQWLQRIDFTTSRNRIPLIDTATGEVRYGIDALLRLLGNRWAWIEKAGQWPGLHWMLEKLYALISYNRKVVVAVKCGPREIDCAPEFHLGYRVLFLSLLLIFSAGFTSFAWEGMQQYVASFRIHNQTLAYTLLLLLILLAVRGFFLPLEKRMEFYGQCGMLLLFSSFSVALWMGLSLLLGQSLLLFVFGAGVSLTNLFRSYRKRMRFAGFHLQQIIV